MTFNKTKFTYAVIIPSYNEEKRLPFKLFQEFADNNKHVLLCFVNDGSKDRTLAVLSGLQVCCPDNVCVYDMPQNGGKAEAVRHGVVHVYENFEVPYIGFLDADFATHPQEWLKMAEYKKSHAQYGAVIGSRIQRLGASIQRDDNRSFFSSMIKVAIRKLLSTRIQDSQCGAKVFERELVPFLFSKSFITPWLFDVEIFLRIQKKFGKTTLQKGVVEYPLMNWTEVGGSKIKFKDMIKIPLQLVMLYYYYHLTKKHVVKR